MIHHGVRRGLGVQQLIQRDAQQLAHIFIAQRPREQWREHGVDGATVTQHAIAQVLHQRALVGGLVCGLARQLLPRDGELVIEIASGGHAFEHASGHALRFVHQAGGSPPGVLKHAPRGIGKPFNSVAVGSRLPPARCSSSTLSAPWPQAMMSSPGAELHTVPGSSG